MFIRRFLLVVFPSPDVEVLVPAPWRTVLPSVACLPVTTLPPDPEVEKVVETRTPPSVNPVGDTFVALPPL
jgi:hypothetical protein